MKLRQLFSRRQPAERSSLTGILPRLQRMRQSCEWQPVVTPELVEEREQRVAQARKNVVWQPEQFDRTGVSRREPKDGTKRLTWILVLAIAALAAYVCVYMYLEPRASQARQMSARTFTYRLAANPGFLSESLAISVAHDALKENGLNVPNLTLSTNSNTRTLAPAPAGTRDSYLVRSSPRQGDLFFTQPDGQEYQVAVVLVDGQLWCTIFTNLLVPVRQPLK